MWLEAVDRELRSKLPVALAPHIRVANVAQGRLSLRTHVAAWANRARLQSDDILQAARSIGLTVERVEIRVAKAAPIPRSRCTFGVEEPGYRAAASSSAI